MSALPMGDDGVMSATTLTRQLERIRGHLTEIRVVTQLKKGTLLSVAGLFVCASIGSGRLLRDSASQQSPQ